MKTSPQSLNVSISRLRSSPPLRIHALSRPLLLFTLLISSPHSLRGGTPPTPIQVPPRRARRKKDRRACAEGRGEGELKPQSLFIPACLIVHHSWTFYTNAASALPSSRAKVWDPKNFVRSLPGADLSLWWFSEQVCFPLKSHRNAASRCRTPLTNRGRYSISSLSL
jgi:hypothetical protein